VDVLADALDVDLVVLVAVLEHAVVHVKEPVQEAVQVVVELVKVIAIPHVQDVHPVLDRVVGVLHVQEHVQDIVIMDALDRM
jgi:hypothetical protein